MKPIQRNDETIKPIQRNDKIMLAVFRRFLNNPQPFALERNDSRMLSSYIPYEECKNDDSNCAEDQWCNLLRWHVIVLMTEFVINETATRIPIAIDSGRPAFVYGGGSNRTPTEYLIFQKPIDCLNWSGQQLYDELENDSSQRQEHGLRSSTQSSASKAETVKPLPPCRPPQQ